MKQGEGLGGKVDGDALIGTVGADVRGVGLSLAHDQKASRNKLVIVSLYGVISVA